MEHRRVGCVVVRTEHTAGRENLDGGIFLFHYTDLPCGRLRSQEQVFRQIEGILHISCRVVLGGIECRKVIIIGFNFRAFEHLEPHPCEDIDEFILHQSDWVQRARMILFTWHRNVDAFRGVLLLHFLFFYNHRARFKSGFHALFEFVYDFPEDRFFFLRQILHPCHDGFQFLLEFHLQFVKRSTAFRVFHCRQNFLAQGIDFFLHILLL